MQFFWCTLLAAVVTPILTSVIGFPVSVQQCENDNKSGKGILETDDEHQLRKTLKSFSRVHIKESVSAPEKIDQAMRYLAPEKSDCRNITWYSTIHHSIFGGRRLCV